MKFRFLDYKFIQNKKGSDLVGVRCNIRTFKLIHTMENVINNKNGIDVDRLMGTIDAVKKDPEVANFQFRARTEWLDGGHC